MTNPIVVNIRRADRVESHHRGSVVVLDADGAIVLALGDIERLVYPRSAVKAIQALPLIESGAAERFGLNDAEIALACASHMGEEVHADTAKSMLRKAGQSADALECGAHWPFSVDAARAMAQAHLQPSALHNNCSGKHAGFVCTACATDNDPAGYVAPHHPVQVMIRDAMESLTGAIHDPDGCGTDGCSIPTYAVPLKSLALGFARFGSGVGLAPKRAAAARRIRLAMANAPEMLSGQGKFDTLIAATFGERVIAKVGAEGVYCGAFPDAGMGVAIKCDDGSMAAAELMMAAVTALCLTSRSETQEQTLQKLMRPELRNWNGRLVGQVEPAEVFAAGIIR
jgi:L-asparaginase II